MVKDRTTANANGLFAGVKIVCEYMKNTANPLLEGLIEPTERELCLRGLFLRAASWMLTLTKLNNPVDVQAIVSANRSILEATVDTVLVSGDRSSESVERMRWWERSAKLHAAENLVRFFVDRGLTIPAEYEVQKLYVQTNEVEIKKERLKRWPSHKGKHPPRWTGNRLDKDVLAADPLFENLIREELGQTLNELYQTEYRRMNFYVHGSALTGIRGLSADSIASVCAVGFNSCADLSMACTKVILTELAFANTVPAVREEWEAVKRVRALSWAQYQPELAPMIKGL